MGSTLFLAALVAASTDRSPTGERDSARNSDLTTANLAPQLLAAHNRERAGQKLPPLALDAKLTAAAQLHADDMALNGKMSHEGSVGSTPFDRIKRQGFHYRSAAENVAA